MGRERSWNEREEMEKENIKTEMKENRKGRTKYQRKKEGIRRARMSI